MCHLLVIHATLQRGICGMVIGGSTQPYELVNYINYLINLIRRFPGPGMSWPNPFYIDIRRHIFVCNNITRVFLVYFFVLRLVSGLVSHMFSFFTFSLFGHELVPVFCCWRFSQELRVLSFPRSRR